MGLRPPCSSPAETIILLLSTQEVFLAPTYRPGGIARHLFISHIRWDAPVAVCADTDGVKFNCELSYVNVYQFDKKGFLFV